jgi:hypothetical protein
MHHDDIDWADKMTAWKNDAANKKSGVAGDDRSPSWRWIGSLYHDNKLIVIPQDNIMRSIMEGGAMVPVPGGKSGKTFKSQTQSGIASADAYWPLTVNGQTISVAEVHKLMQIEDFAAHKEAVLEHGFSLFLKRARIGQAKHIRVRPRFDSWSVSGTLIVLDKQITQAVLTDILMYSGQYKGLGDWRPGGKTPGPYGMFTAKVTKVM